MPTLLKLLLPSMTSSVRCLMAKKPMLICTPLSPRSWGLVLFPNVVLLLMNLRCTISLSPHCPMILLSCYLFIVCVSFLSLFHYFDDFILSTRPLFSVLWLIPVCDHYLNSTGPAVFPRRLSQNLSLFMAFSRHSIMISIIGLGNSHFFLVIFYYLCQYCELLQPHHLLSAPSRSLLVFSLG